MHWRRVARPSTGALLPPLRAHALRCGFHSPALFFSVAICLFESMHLPGVAARSRWTHDQQSSLEISIASGRQGGTSVTIRLPLLTADAQVVDEPDRGIASRRWRFVDSPLTNLQIRSKLAPTTFLDKMASNRLSLSVVSLAASAVTAVYAAGYIHTQAADASLGAADAGALSGERSGDGSAARSHDDEPAATVDGAPGKLKQDIGRWNGTVEHGRYESPRRRSGVVVDEGWAHRQTRTSLALHEG